MILDAHQHVWDLTRARYDWLGPQHGLIFRTITEDEALPRLRRCGVDGVVLVQAADNAEDTAHMLATAARFAEVVAVVAYLPLEDPAAVAEQLPALAADPLVVGIRTLIHDLPDPDFLLRPEVGESLAMLAEVGLSYDVVAVLPRHLEHVPVLAERYPGLRLVIDHLAAPPIGNPGVEPWWSLLTRAAEYPDVYAKVSGLYPADDLTRWSTEAVRPFVEHALDVFGPRRLMYGGDWPVSILAGDYDRVWAGLTPIWADLSANDRAEVLSGTAVRCYGIDPDRLAALPVP
ncbi:amidohydrolase family protein [uncultured Friedmanniella sp.]|uniref:amidohydrolase family protein n=1 Tax=uncultured Friedmanniella sp. TaxID=335381 RepID=UPI0035C99EBA